MSTLTTNYGLVKPDANEHYSISVQNDNMDAIDTALHDLDDSKAEQTEVEELKKSVSDGKTLVANAITEKGVTTATDASFSTMASNINSIEVGIDTSGTTASSEYILEGKTAGVRGEIIIGTMADNTLLKNGDDYVGSDYPTHPLFSVDGVNVRYKLSWGANKDKSGLMIVPPIGYWSGIRNAYVYISNSVLVDQLGITESKMLETLTIAGITGTITNRNKWSWCLDVIDSGSAIDVVPQEGYYDGARDSCTCIQYSDLASVLGITADKILTGNTICKVSGTAVSGKRYASGMEYTIGTHPNSLYIYYRTMQATSETYRTTNSTTIAIDTGFTASIIKVAYTYVSSGYTYTYTGLIRYNGNSFQFDCLRSDGGVQYFGYNCYFAGYVEPRVGNIFYIPTSTFPNDISSVSWEAWE
jgi:hypothetical protein